MNQEEKERKKKTRNDDGSCVALWIAAVSAGGYPLVVDTSMALPGSLHPSENIV